jgi:hypothetical protein
VLSILVISWTALPALGALALGMWIRRLTRDAEGEGAVAP